jgi:hypothetical protein
MEQYDTLSEAIAGLKRRGFTEDFNLSPTCLECSSLQIQVHPEDFEITEVHRFEGMSNPDDNSVLYGIEAKNGIKGILVDAYGVYSEALTEEMARKLRKETV